MFEIIENSRVLNFLWKAVAKISNAFLSSAIVSTFLSPSDNSGTVTGSIFYKVYDLIRLLCVKVFESLKINRLLKGSIFKMPYIWCFLTILIAPFAPTMVVLTAAMASFGSLFLKLACDKTKNLKYFALNKYVYMYAAIYMLAAMVSVARGASFKIGLITAAFVLFYIVVVNAIETRRQLDALVFFMLSAGVLVALYGFYQFLFPGKFGGVWVDTDMFSDIAFRVYSTFGNPNVLGEYFLLIIPIGVAYFFNSKKPLLKLIYFGAVSVMMLCLVLTYSRGCWLGIMAAAGVFLVLLDKRFIILGILALCAMPFVLPDTIINRFMSIGNMADSSTSYRVSIWLGTIAMLKDYWLSGIGPGEAAYNRVYPSYGYNGVSAPHSHNLFLQITCDTGISGLFVFCFMILRYFRDSLSAVLNAKNKENKILAIGAVSSITGFMVQSMFDYTFYNYRVMILFWIVLGIGVIFSNVDSLKEDRKL
ncbi:MAG: hypothetical protein E7235_03040 [Lachnospiraceae bacterium]|nr:hypothetical protein [Lachnospiraceae bacterium]